MEIEFSKNEILKCPKIGNRFISLKKSCMCPPRCKFLSYVDYSNRIVNCKHNTEVKKYTLYVEWNTNYTWKRVKNITIEDDDFVDIEEIILFDFDTHEIIKKLYKKEEK